MNTFNSNLALGRIVNRRPAAQRILLYPGEVYHLPNTTRQLHSVSGRAWVSHGGRDTILHACETVMLPAGHDAALISGLGQNPLVVEVLDSK